MPTAIWSMVARVRKEPDRTPVGPGGATAPPGAGAAPTPAPGGTERDGGDDVRARLQAYADRGVFRGFAEQPARGGRRRFTFLWLAPAPFTLHYQPATGVLVFRDLLPNVPGRSRFAADLRRFVRGRAQAGLPEHRRIDPRTRPGRLLHPPRVAVGRDRGASPATTATA